MQNDRNVRAFKTACAKNDIDSASHLLSMIKITTENHYILSLAVETGNVDLVKRVIDKKVNIRNFNYDAFHCACGRGYLEIAKYLYDLLPLYCRIRCINSNQNLALILACEEGHLDVVKWLVEKGVDITDGYWRAYKFAKKYNRQDVADYLLSLVTYEDDRHECINSFKSDEIII